MKKHNGGPAFPLAGSETENGDIQNYPEFGMSLRDWFAGQALAGQALKRADEWWADYELAAKRCYKIADAMLAEREK